MTGRRAGSITAGAMSWLCDIRPQRATLKQDVLAGLPGAISSVPDGMASSVPPTAVCS